MRNSAVVIDASQINRADEGPASAMKRLLPAVLSVCISAAVAAGAMTAPQAHAVDVTNLSLGSKQTQLLFAGSSLGPILSPGNGSPIDNVSAYIHGSSQGAQQAVQDNWRKAYNQLPQQVRDSVPPHLRPAPQEEETVPVTVVPAAEPTLSPNATNCSNCVAITYDDGPVPGTERLLDIFKRKNAHATFFVVGNNVNANPKILRRIRAEGHTIGNHSYSHPDLARQSDGTIGSQLSDTSAAIEKQSGVKVHWVRPPYGSYDGRVINASKARGLSLAIWDVDTMDWSHRDTARTCSIAVNQAQAGSIVLMHDIHEPTINAAECIIDGLRAKGLRPVSLDEMIKDPVPGRVYTHAN